MTNKCIIHTFNGKFIFSTSETEALSAFWEFQRKLQEIGINGDNVKYKYVELYFDNGAPVEKVFFRHEER